jgi:cytochrome c oxidase cbb3-type subunit 3
MTRSTGSAAVRIGVILTAVALAGTWILMHVRDQRLGAALVRAAPDRVLSNASLVSFALGVAKPAYATHCAGCHGSGLRGDRQRGVPDLEDGAWLYGQGEVASIEATILYGIRSGHPKAHNITDMPAFGRIGQLSGVEVHDVVEYVYGLSHSDGDRTAARRGAVLYADKGSCYDCHGADGSGNIDYGAPQLTGGAWLYGGDRSTLYDSVYNGRHGLCPAWIGRLTPVEIRALAIYLHESSLQRLAAR